MITFCWRYNGGMTRTNKALEEANTCFFSERVRRNKPQVLIVMTDGKINQGSKPYSVVLAPLRVNKHRCRKTCWLPMTNGRYFNLLLKSTFTALHGTNCPDSLKQGGSRNLGKGGAGGGGGGLKWYPYFKRRLFQCFSYRIFQKFSVKSRGLDPVSPSPKSTLGNTCQDLCSNNSKRLVDKTVLQYR